MYDLETADKIFTEMLMENPDFAKKLVKEWRTRMPQEYARTMFLAKWGCHITTKEFYNKGLKFITNDDSKPIEPWSVEDILNIAKNYINIHDEDFYDLDLAMMVNILKGDIYNIVKDIDKIVLIAIKFLTDEDYPFSDPSERAYKWVECHLEKQREQFEKQFK